MRVYSHFAVRTLSNTYVVGLPTGVAILVDPAVFDGAVLEFLEHHKYVVSCVLLTHANNDHLAGLRTLRSVYSDIRICAAKSSIAGKTGTPVEPGGMHEIGGVTVRAIGFPGMGRDCLGFSIGGFLFTGIALSAGELGAVSNPYAKAMLLDDIARGVFTLPDATVILPFYGPPTTVGVERRTLPMEGPPELEGRA